MPMPTYQSARERDAAPPEALVLSRIKGLKSETSSSQNVSSPYCLTTTARIARKTTVAVQYTTIVRIPRKFSLCPLSARIC